MADCTFCAIVAGEVPARLVHETDTTMAFLDVRPVFPGHTLVVPKTHHVTLPDLPADEVGPFFAEVRLLSAAVRDGLDAHGTFVAMNNTVSQSVPHLHCHVVPRRFKDGLRGFFWPRQPYASDEEADAAAERIRAAVVEAGASQE